MTKELRINRYEIVDLISTEAIVFLVKQSLRSKDFDLNKTIIQFEDFEKNQLVFQQED